MELNTLTKHQIFALENPITNTTETNLEKYASYQVITFTPSYLGINIVLVFESFSEGDEKSFDWHASLSIVGGKDIQSAEIIPYAKWNDKMKEIAMYSLGIMVHNVGQSETEFVHSEKVLNLFKCATSEEIELFSGLQQSVTPLKET